MILTLEDILSATQGQLLYANNVSGQFPISTDTRTIKNNDIYLPLCGESFDGHNFIDNAIQKGCAGYFIDKKHYKQFDAKHNAFAISVENTLEAYLKMANFIRKKVAPIVIMVTGSTGKTTVKEMIYSVLEPYFKTQKSQLNHNNEIGLCQTLFTLEENTEIIIVEAGMRGPGEIELLSKYAEPDGAVITNIAPAHIGRLGSLENIAKAKCEITLHLNEEGCLLAHNDDLIKRNLNWSGKKIFYDLSNIEIIDKNAESIKFLYKNYEYTLNVPGEYNALNAIVAIEVGLKLGLTPEKIDVSLKQYKSIEKRWDIIELENNVKVINDSYNANPLSITASLATVLENYQNLSIVLGDMGELGEWDEHYHRQIGIYLQDKVFEKLITVGQSSKFIAEESKKTNVVSFETTEDAAKYIKNNTKPDSVILLKASRFMEFEKIVKELK